MNFRSNQLYPCIEVEKKNTEFAKLLLEDYAGDTSEDSAIHLYIFQTLILNETHPKIANDLFQIAIVEMHHLKLLGKTIHALGLSPEYVTYQSDSERKHYWSSKNINYTTSLKEILKLDIEQEEHAICEYLSHYEIIIDPNIRSLLLRIIEDEKIHLEYFKKQLMILESKNIQ